MIRLPGTRSLHLLSLLFLSIFLHFISDIGLASYPTSPRDGNSTTSHDTSSDSILIKVVLICLGVVAVAGFTLVLFKLWQKKKKEEQHARLLKLFEDDDELEVELGMRD